MENEIQVLPSGSFDPEPLFTPDQYKKFCESWRQETEQKLKECARKSALSAHEARNRVVD